MQKSDINLGVGEERDCRKHRKITIPDAVPQAPDPETFARRWDSFLLLWFWSLSVCVYLVLFRFLILIFLVFCFGNDAAISWKLWRSRWGRTRSRFWRRDRARLWSRSCCCVRTRIFFESRQIPLQFSWFLLLFWSSKWVYFSQQLDWWCCCCFFHWSMLLLLLLFCYW